MLGRAEEVEVHIDKALRLSPRDSFASVWCTMAGTAKLMLGYHDEALAWLYRAIEANQTYPTAHLTLAAALAWQRRAAEAQAAATAGLALAPSFNIRRFRTGVPSDNPTYLAQREHLYEGLRLAGVPEGESRGTKVVHLACASAEKRHLRAEPERSNAVRFTRP
jgi:tetratricopeptide (TPR) repeat protein